MYGARSEAGKRPPAQSPIDTAGLRWHPETWPMAYAIVRTVNPNANETPSRPIPTSGTAAASTALPHPPNTSQNVPMNSAVARCVILIAHLWSRRLTVRKTIDCLIAIFIVGDHA